VLLLSCSHSTQGIRMPVCRSKYLSLRYDTVNHHVHVMLPGTSRGKGCLIFNLADVHVSATKHSRGLLHARTARGGAVAAELLPSLWRAATSLAHLHFAIKYGQYA
jgi:hypothetical protein